MWEANWAQKNCLDEEHAFARLKLVLVHVCRCRGRGGITLTALCSLAIAHERLPNGGDGARSAVPLIRFCLADMISLETLQMQPFILHLFANFHN